MKIQGPSTSEPPGATSKKRKSSTSSTRGRKTKEINKYESIEDDQRSVPRMSASKQTIKSRDISSASSKFDIHTKTSQRSFPEIRVGDVVVCASSELPLKPKLSNQFLKELDVSNSQVQLDRSQSSLFEIKVNTKEKERRKILFELSKINDRINKILKESGLDNAVEDEEEDTTDAIMQLQLKRTQNKERKFLTNEVNQYLELSMNRVQTLNEIQKWIQNQQILIEQALVETEELDTLEAKDMERANKVIMKSIQDFCKTSGNMAKVGQDVLTKIQLLIEPFSEKNIPKSTVVGEISMRSSKEMWELGLSRVETILEYAYKWVKSVTMKNALRNIKRQFVIMMDVLSKKLTELTEAQAKLDLSESQNSVLKKMVDKNNVEIAHFKELIAENETSMDELKTKLSDTNDLNQKLIAQVFKTRAHISALQELLDEDAKKKFQQTTQGATGPTKKLQFRLPQPAEQAIDLSEFSGYERLQAAQQKLSEYKDLVEELGVKIKNLEALLSKERRTSYYLKSALSYKLKEQSMSSANLSSTSQSINKVGSTEKTSSQQAESSVEDNEMAVVSEEEEKVAESKEGSKGKFAEFVKRTTYAKKAAHHIKSSVLKLKAKKEKAAKVKHARKKGMKGRVERLKERIKKEAKEVEMAAEKETKEMKGKVERIKERTKKEAKEVEMAAEKETKEMKGKAEKIKETTMKEAKVKEIAAEKEAKVKQRSSVTDHKLVADEKEKKSSGLSVEMGEKKTTSKQDISARKSGDELTAMIFDGRDSILSSDDGLASDLIKLTEEMKQMDIIPIDKIVSYDYLADASKMSFSVLAQAEETTSSSASYEEMQSTGDLSTSEVRKTSQTADVKLILPDSAEENLSFEQYALPETEQGGLPDFREAALLQVQPDSSKFEISSGAASAGWDSKYVSRESLCTVYPQSSSSSLESVSSEMIPSFSSGSPMSATVSPPTPGVTQVTSLDEFSQPSKLTEHEILQTSEDMLSDEYERTAQSVVIDSDKQTKLITPESSQSDSKEHATSRPKFPTLFVPGEQVQPELAKTEITKTWLEASKFQSDQKVLIKQDKLEELKKIAFIKKQQEEAISERATLDQEIQFRKDEEKAFLMMIMNSCEKIHKIMFNFRNQIARILKEEGFEKESKTLLTRTMTFVPEDLFNDSMGKVSTILGRYLYTIKRFIQEMIRAMVLIRHNKPLAKIRKKLSGKEGKTQRGLGQLLSDTESEAISLTMNLQSLLDISLKEKESDELNIDKTIELELSRSKSAHDVWYERSHGQLHETRPGFDQGPVRGTYRGLGGRLDQVLDRETYQGMAQQRVRELLLERNQGFDRERDPTYLERDQRLGHETYRRSPRENFLEYLGETDQRLGRETHQVLGQEKVWVPPSETDQRAGRETHRVLGQANVWVPPSETDQRAGRETHPVLGQAKIWVPPSETDQRAGRETHQVLGQAKIWVPPSETDQRAGRETRGQEKVWVPPSETDQRAGRETQGQEKVWVPPSETDQRAGRKTYRELSLKIPMERDQRLAYVRDERDQGLTQRTDQGLTRRTDQGFVLESDWGFTPETQYVTGARLKQKFRPLPEKLPKNIEYSITSDRFEKGEQRFPAGTHVMPPADMMKRDDYQRQYASPSRKEMESKTPREKAAAAEITLKLFENKSSPSLLDSETDVFSEKKSEEAISQQKNVGIFKKKDREEAEIKQITTPLLREVSLEKLRYMLTPEESSSKEKVEATFGGKKFPVLTSTTSRESTDEMKSEITRSMSDSVSELEDSEYQEDDKILYAIPAKLKNENLLKLSKALEEKKVTKDLYQLAKSVTMDPLLITQDHFFRAIKKFISFRSAKMGKKVGSKMDEMTDEDSTTKSNDEMPIQILHYYERMRYRIRNRISTPKVELEKLQTEKQDMFLIIWSLFKEMFQEHGINLNTPVLKKDRKACKRKKSSVLGFELPKLLVDRRSTVPSVTAIAPDFMGIVGKKIGEATWKPSNSTVKMSTKSSVVTPVILTLDVNSKKLITRKSYFDTYYRVRQDASAKKGFTDQRKMFKLRNH